MGYLGITSKPFNWLLQSPPCFVQNYVSMHFQSTFFRFLGQLVDWGPLTSFGAMCPKGLTWNNFKTTHLIFKNLRCDGDQSIVKSFGANRSKWLFWNNFKIIHLIWIILPKFCSEFCTDHFLIKCFWKFWLWGGLGLNDKFWV